MPKERKKLPIACTDTDCENGLHCFKATHQMTAKNHDGICRACGIQLVDWVRVRTRNLRDVDNTFEMLRFEKVRHFFWHIVRDVMPISGITIEKRDRRGWVVFEAQRERLLL